MNVSQRLSDATTSKASRLITAIDTAFTNYEKTELPENSQFGFKAILQTPYVILENCNPENNYEGFDMEFEIPFDDDAIANEAEFIVYNLSKETINKFKVNNTIRLTAGYGKDTGIIFEGYISKVKTVKEGVDTVTTIYALDDVKYSSQMMDEKTYAEGTKASTILKDLLGRLNLPIEVFKPQRDHIYYDETKIDGSIVDNIKEYSDVCGVSTYIYKQKIYCRPIWDGDNLHFNINVNTGMIGSPEPFEEENSNEEYVDKLYGYDITMILQHRLGTAGIVKVDSLSYTGEYRVISGTHSYDGLSATTKFKCMEKVNTTIDETKIESPDSSSGSSSSKKTKVMKVAEAEIGTKETGTNNNKYGKELGQNGVSWCGIFVAWCMKHGGAGLPSFNYASASSFAYAAQNNGWGTYHKKGGSYKPKRGDLFIRGYDGTAHSNNAHVGFVRKTSNGTTFTTVEGNSSDKVNTRTLNVSDYTFVTPPY